MKKTGEKKPKSTLRKVLEGIFTGLFVALICVGCFVLISNNITARKSKRDNAPTQMGNRYLPVLVITDSMEPEYKVGTALFVKKVSCEEIANNFVNPTLVEGEKTIYEHVYDLTFYDAYSGNINNIKQEDKDALINYGKDDRTSTTGTTMTHRLFRVVVRDNVEYGQGKYLFFVEGINTASEHQAQDNQFQVFSENELYGVVTGQSTFIGGFFKFVTSPWGLVILLLIPSLYMVFSSILDVYKASKEPDEENEKQVDPNDPLKGLSKKQKEQLKKEMLGEIMGKDEK